MTSPLQAFNRGISELQKKPVGQARGIFNFDETCFYGAPVSPVVATLSYHKIGNPPYHGWLTWNYISTEEFSAQMEWFQRRGWEFLSASALLDALKGKGAIPAKSLLITFDDAYESLLENAVPVLKRFSAPAVVFAPTQFVGETNLFDHGVEPLERIADWKTLRALEDSGVSVESHGISHRGFSSLSQDEIVQELDFSREAIRKNLAKESRLFAFPYGDCGNNQTAVHSAIHRAGYEVAFLYGGGLFDLGQTPAPLFLPRLAMGPGVDLEAMLLESSVTRGD
ncbi:MAG: polysaccharide deacetylase family protein [Spartobacteria bacterium]